MDGLGGGLSAGASHTHICSYHSATHCAAGEEGERGVEGGTRALALALGRFRNKHGQAGVSDLDLGGRRAAVIGGLGFGAVVRAWALLLLLVQVLAQVLVPQVPRFPPVYSLKFYGV